MTDDRRQVGESSLRPSRRQRPALFLDRDGTLIRFVDYLTHPDEVELDPGAIVAIHEARGRGEAVVVVTNQSAVGRGRLTESGLARVHDRLHLLLEAEGIVLDGIFWCPVVPGARDRTVVEHPDRKPGPGMILAAAAQLKLDLSRSVIVGDMVSDVLAGVNAGIPETWYLTDSERECDPVAVSVASGTGDWVAFSRWRSQAGDA